MLSNLAKCSDCGCLFKPTAGETFCSVECSDRYQARHTKCGACGVSFAKHNHAQKYCSPNCKRATMNQRRRLKDHQAGRTPDQQPRQCVVCGKDFNTTNVRNIYCSKPCRQLVLTLDAAKRRREAGMQPAEQPRNCETCGQPFVTGQWSQVTCGRACRKLYKAELRKASK